MSKAKSGHMGFAMRKYIKYVIAGSIIIAPLLAISFANGINGSIVDAETGKPIEGASVNVSWTMIHGFGLTYHTVHKLSGTTTNGRGHFMILGPINPFVDKPAVTIYRKGYVAWSNRYEFLEDLTKRQSPDWVDVKDITIPLKKFAPEYEKDLPEVTNNLPPTADVSTKNWTLHYRIVSNTFFDPHVTHQAHRRYISSNAYPATREFMRALEWEEKREKQEEDTVISLRMSATVVDEETDRPIEGAVGLALGSGMGYDYPTSYKETFNKVVNEFVSNKKGELTISAEFPLLNPPQLTIYKKGYVAWQSNRETFIWKNATIIKLSKVSSQSPDSNWFNYLATKKLIPNDIKTQFSETLEHSIKESEKWK